MSIAGNYNSFPPLSPFPRIEERKEGGLSSSPPSLPSIQRLGATERKGTDKVSELMEQILDQKQKYLVKARTERWNLNEFVQVGGDLFSMGYLAFQGAQIVKKSLAASSAIGLASSICGVFAGVINIGVAFSCLFEGIQASKNGDKKLALRLYSDFVCLLCIGTVMSLASLASRLIVLGAIHAFFTANPWLLPVLFFVISIPVIVEIGSRIKHIWANTNLAAQLNGADVRNLVFGKEPDNPYHLSSLIEMGEREGGEDEAIRSALSRKMEQLQADMGVEAAIETFRLLRQILNNENIEEQLTAVKKKISEWNRAQYVRMFQQILYIGAFGASMGALSPKINTPTLNGIETFAMSGGNAIPLYMDLFWPFKRNTPIVVPIVEI